MERLLSVKDMMERYQCSRNTAIKYMRKMEHQESPLKVTERAVTAWEKSRTVKPPEVVRMEMMMARMQKRA